MLTNWPDLETQLLRRSGLGALELFSVGLKVCYISGLMMLSCCILTCGKQLC